MLGNVRLSSERLEDTPPSSESPKATLLLDDTGGPFQILQIYGSRGEWAFQHQEEENLGLNVKGATVGKRSGQVNLGAASRTSGFIFLRSLLCLFKGGGGETE